MKLYEYGWEIPCFFAFGRRKRGPYILSLMEAMR